MVGRAELAPADEPHAHGLEEAAVTARMCARVGASGVGSRPSIPTPMPRVLVAERQTAGRAGGADAGNRREPALDFLERRQSLPVVGVFARRGSDQRAPWSVPRSRTRVGVQQPVEAAQGQPGADEQQRGEGDLADDQAGSQTAPHVSGRSPAVLQRLVDVLTRDVPRREQPEDETGEDRDREREERARVHRGRCAAHRAAADRREPARRSSPIAH